MKSISMLTRSLKTGVSSSMSDEKETVELPDIEDNRESGLLTDDD